MPNTWIADSVKHHSPLFFIALKTEHSDGTIREGPQSILRQQDPLNTLFMRIESLREALTDSDTPDASVLLN